MLLVDASVYIFRAWFSLPATMTGPDGEPVNAAYGFADFLAGLLGETQPTHAAIAFDESLDSSFRNEIDPDYKANREPAPPSLKAQITVCMALCRALGLATLSSPRYEADDLIGTLAARARQQGRAVTIVSTDKDLAQLLVDGDCLYDYARGARLDPAAIIERFGVRCAQMPDYLGLVGDAVDNIPGVAGIGAKTAAALLADGRDLDSLYANLDAVAAMPIRGATAARRKLEAGREAAFRSRELARIVTDVPLDVGPEDIRWEGTDTAALVEWCDQLGLGSRLRQRLTDLCAPHER
ncbi:5'-3' exonuclease H3TH domain-containing protein [Salinisphaera sp. P385]|uniref:5'-3' exonuclease H3TH domain-containing protein n=1 Tax=Spectribacter acetivorans TaxID=3075603 RepID=A0ABU3B9M5_9GAMM|nr:5'-3' exonuclease H3TH domain-containing protein [Salinisphaera sp. P385]MDT0618780.1 5'-3' exonuclease H3TH domain-containing protein [Salinisphaera sp. P385]